MINNFKIGNKNIGENSPVFIIAELSANHNQDINIAFKSIDAIKETGADAVKLQTYTPDTITIDVKNKYFTDIHKGTLWEGYSLYDLYKKAYTPWDWQPKLKEYAESIGLVCFSAPFDLTAVDFLEKMNVPAYKIASFEINDIPLIEKVAKTGKPIIISTGIATEEEIDFAIEMCRKQGNNQIALLKCTSAYPTPMEDVNVSAIQSLKTKYKTIVGLSDHSTGIEVPILSIVFGAKIIEKHFILEKNKFASVDEEFSLDKNEFAQMVAAVRNAEKAIGNGKIELTQKMENSRKFSRSLFVVENIKKGEKITAINVRSIRPAFGLHTKYYYDVLGKLAKKDIKKGTPMSLDFVE